MFVDEGVEGHPVPPAGGEVVDVDVWISGHEKKEEQQVRVVTSGPVCRFVGSGLTLRSSSDTTAAERL